MRRLTLLLTLVLAAALPAQQKPATTIQLPPRPLLPMSFAGWTAISAPVESAKPDAAFQARQSLLTELGFRREATATYQKSGGNLNVQAIQFEDATGAYGFFAGGIGDTSAEPEIRFPQVCAGLCPTEFRKGDTVVQLVDAKKEDIETLAKTLPIPFGSKGQIPLLPSYLPRTGLNAQSVQYALGPVGFSAMPSPLAGKLDFSTDAEVVVANYGSGTLTLIEYPTPQMAIAQLQSIASMLQLKPQKDLPDGLLGNSNEVAWRTGPLVALTSGMSQAQAIKLAGEVHYEATITWNHPEGYVSDAWRAAHLYLGIFALAGVLCGASVIMGLFFGGARAISRVLRGKSASSVEDIEFISLNLGTGGELQHMEAERRRSL